LHLHATGDDAFDLLRIEANGLLVRRGFEHECAAAIWSALSARDSNWDAIALPGMRSDDPLLAAARASGWLLDAVPLAAPYVDFSALRGRVERYCDALDKKARYTVRSAEKSYERALGALSVRVPGTESAAQTALAQLAAWSTRRWGRRQQASAFASEYFRAFHQSLLRRSWTTGFTRIYAVHAGDTCIGYMHAFEQDGWISFYQCGYDYDLLSDEGQPGYASLGTLIEHCFASGARAFDFLGDPVLYKRRLATHSREFVWATAARPTLVRGVKQAGRQVWRAARRGLRIGGHGRGGHSAGKPKSSR
jgi:CelD/BcsL family acetyltransferase involved in cellulose biosynthesis